MSVVSSVKSEGPDGFYGGQYKRPLSIIEENDGDEGDTGTSPVKENPIVHPAPEINAKDITIETKMTPTTTAKSKGVNRNDTKNKPHNTDASREDPLNLGSESGITPTSPVSPDTKTSCKFLPFSKNIRIQPKTDPSSKMPPPVAPKPKTPSPSPTKLKSPWFSFQTGNSHSTVPKSPACSQSKNKAPKSNMSDAQTSEDEVVRSMKNLVKRTVSKIENHVASITSATKQKTKSDPPRRKISKEEFPCREKGNHPEVSKPKTEVEMSTPNSTSTPSCTEVQELNLTITPKSSTEAEKSTDSPDSIPSCDMKETLVHSHVHSPSSNETENVMMDSPDSTSTYDKKEVYMISQICTPSSKETGVVASTLNLTSTPKSSEIENPATEGNCVPTSIEKEIPSASLKSTPMSKETETFATTQMSSPESVEKACSMGTQKSTPDTNETENSMPIQKSPPDSKETENSIPSQKFPTDSKETENSIPTQKFPPDSKETEKSLPTQKSPPDSKVTENSMATQKSQPDSKETENSMPTQKSPLDSKRTENSTTTQVFSSMSNDKDNSSANLSSTLPIKETERSTNTTPQISTTLSSETEDTISIAVPTPNYETEKQTLLKMSSSSKTTNQQTPPQISQTPSVDGFSSSLDIEVEDTLMYQGENSQQSTSESTTPEFTTPPSSPTMSQSRQISNALFSPLLSTKTSHSSSELTRKNSKAGQILSDGQGLARIREAAESLRLTSSSHFVPKASPSPPSHRVPFSFRQSPKLSHRPYPEAYSFSSLNNSKSKGSFSLKVLSLPSHFSTRGDSGTSDSENEEKSQNKTGEKSRMAPRSPFLAPKFHPRRGSYFFKRRMSSESLASLSENESTDNAEEPTPISASDFIKLKETAERLHLSTRRPSVLQWRQQYVESPGTLGFPFRNGMNGDSFDEKLTSERKQKIDETLNWLKNELQEMRSQDQILARQLLTIRNDIHQLKLRRCTTEHQELLDDFKLEIEEQQEFSDVLDIPQPIYEDNPLKHIGVTRLNISARRFSAC